MANLAEKFSKKAQANRQNSEQKTTTAIVEPTRADVLRRIEHQAMRRIHANMPVLAEMADIVFEDPGADISPEDSELWLTLFTWAREIDVDFYARLFYVRGGGARLVEHEKFGYIIQPIIDPEGKKGWPTREFYDQEKQCLNPFAGAVTTLLQNLRRWKNQSWPAS